jgi:DNA mismatch repair protein MutL
VKAGDILDVSEMKQLVKDLFATPHYQTCPHGRPTISAFSQEELAKRFNR